MIKILIVENDLKFAKKIVSNIVKENDQIRLIDIITSSNIDDVIITIRKYKPNICILNTDQVKLDKLKYNHFSTFFIYTTDDSLKSAIKKYYLKNDITPIKDAAFKYIADTEYARVKKYIENEFFNLKFNFGIKGTQYLIESILYCYYSPNPYVYENLEKNVYPEVAKKMQSSGHHVKWCIIQAVNEMYDVNLTTGTIRNLCDYFYFSTDYKPTAKVIITTFLTHLWGDI